MLNIKIPNLFVEKSHPMVGIDITSATVKLLELRRNDHHTTVESFSVVPFLSDAILDKEIKNPQAIANAIRIAVQRARTQATQAVLALPTAFVISKVFQFAADLNENDLENQVEIEAGKLIPYAREEIMLDFTVQGPSKKGVNQNDVLVVACRRDYLDMRVDLLADAGLEVKIVEVEAFALQRAINWISEQSAAAFKGEVVAVVDVGASLTTLTIFLDDQILYTREEMFGGRHLTEEIMHRYGLSFQQAGFAKKTGALPDDFIPQVLEPFKALFIQQVHRSLQFFYALGGYIEVDRIILVGGCAVIPGIAQLLEDRVGVQTLVANPFENMLLSSSINPGGLANEAASLVIACGLALRGLEHAKY